MEQTVPLDAGTMLCIEDGIGIGISVQQGRSVITQENDANDTAVAGGGAFTVHRNGKTIVMAQSHNLLRLALPSIALRTCKVEVKTYIGSRAVVLRRLDLPRRGSRLAGAKRLSFLDYLRPRFRVNVLARQTQVPD